MSWNIRHRNLIKILTACSSIDHKENDFKSLVFEFMANGSLDSWLHPRPHHHQGNERNSTILQRLNISIDVALGVNYLHHHSHANIVHYDIKPSNILLDEYFVSRIGNFGLARFFFAATSDINQEQLSSAGYGMYGKVFVEGYIYIYSYGILLLIEIFFGKRPTICSVLMDNGKDLHDYVKKALT
ncbi:putative LRR receptor-like serine/threonine-protein kinase At3g47570 [Apium graveolens]|uniref:putative LRR receptor-like serine/threonine-protein kinase At3g47570 n=1 Tax=Apium graveolens TaxID=4045 RepID=UPI003D78D226